MVSRIASKVGISKLSVSSIVRNTEQPSLLTRTVYGPPGRPETSELLLDKLDPEIAPGSLLFATTPFPAHHSKV